VGHIVVEALEAQEIQCRLTLFPWKAGSFPKLYQAVHDSEPLSGAPDCHLNKTTVTQLPTTLEYHPQLVWRVMAMLWPWIFVTKLCSYRTKWVIHPTNATKAPNFEGKHYLDTWEFAGTNWRWNGCSWLFQMLPDFLQVRQLRTPNQRRPASIQRWKENQRSKTSACNWPSWPAPIQVDDSLDRFEC